jgi:hypothetical protein
MPPQKRSKKAQVSTASLSPDHSPHVPSGVCADELPRTDTQFDDSAGQVRTVDSLKKVDLAHLDEDEDFHRFEEDVGIQSAQNAVQSAENAQSFAIRQGYNTLKSFHGQIYSGMAIGGSHTWNYDQGVWKETKEEPDLWKINYETTKRRARNAPRGSGAPVGTEYHWLIVAHQVRVAVRQVV